MKKLLFAGVLTGTLVLATAAAQAMSIGAFDSASNMASSLSGSGITISSATYTGATAASGYFNGGLAAGIGIEQGIVLSSGLASSLNGTSNTSDATTSNNGVAGSAALDALIPGYTTHDASTLSFDFTFGDGSVGGDAYFNFVFASEEYNEWVDSSFNDVFGFFLDGTAVSDNVAFIPGTSTPVSINNVNNGSNSSYYNDNDPSSTGTPTPFAFEGDGFTDPITISMLGLSAGTHTMTLAIADAGDSVLDSWVFLQGKSFGDDPVPTPEPATMLLFGTGLMGLAGVTFRRKKK